MDDQVASFQVGDRITKEEALELSLFLAAKGKGHVEPNPCVGAVLFDESTGELKAFGHHTKYGAPHAEAEALKNIESAKGLTMVVSLEPCSHHGKTPPCSKLLIEKKLSKLIYIDEDPNPLVSGKGLKMLEEAGVKLEKASSLFSERHRKLNHKFFYAFQNKRAYVHLKWAQSLDGKMSVNQTSKWLTGEESRAYGRQLRSESQVVLVGRKTLELDDPSLNIRREGYDKNLKLAVLDPDLKLLESLKSFKAVSLRAPEDVVVVTKSQNKDLKSDFSIVGLNQNSEGALDLEELTQIFYEKFKIQSLFVEGGSQTLSEFLKQKVYNRISTFVAPALVGKNGDAPSDVLHVLNMKERHLASDSDTKTFGKDVLFDLWFKEN